MSRKLELQKEFLELSMPERRELLGAMMERLKAEGGTMAAPAVGLPSPSVVDAIWGRVVTGFLFVFVGAFIAITVNTYLGKSTETMLTIFTGVMAFLAGLLAPSPLKAVQGKPGSPR